MDGLLDAIMVVLGFIGSFFSGLLGIGGAIINFPLLLLVPSSFGVADFSAQQASAISMFQVFFASLAGILSYRRRAARSALIHKQLVLYMGASILAGSLLGGIGSKFLSNETINVVYGIMAVIGVVLMLLPSKVGPDESVSDIRFNKMVATISAFVVGIVSGIVGAGGAFILIPIMLAVLKIPVRTTVASSLAIVFISAFGGLTGKITAGHVPLEPTIFTVIGSLLGAPLGVAISAKINVSVLRYGLAVVIAAAAVKIWLSI